MLNSPLSSYLVRITENINRKTLYDVPCLDESESLGDVHQIPSTQLIERPTVVRKSQNPKNRRITAINTYEEQDVPSDDESHDELPCIASTDIHQYFMNKESK